jgi:hypothetical protein
LRRSFRVSAAGGVAKRLWPNIELQFAKSAPSSNRRFVDTLTGESGKSSGFTGWNL